MFAKIKDFLSGSGVLLASTIGAGIFALPDIFNRAGYLAGAAYLVILSTVLIYAHSLYWRVRTGGESGHLLGLVKKTLGGPAAKAASVSIVGGLLLTLVVYLVLGSRFLAPALGSGGFGLMLFWAIASLPILFTIPRLAALENIGAGLIILVIFYIFFSAPYPGAILEARTVNTENLFLPFGAILFALSGWTGIDPMIATVKNKKFGGRALAMLAAATMFAAILYALFVAGIFGSASSITADTISGVLGWSAGKIWILIALGLFAIWTSYLPIALEIKTSLEESHGVDPALAAGATIAVPLLLVWAGLDNIFQIIGLAGGIFLAFQYVFIVLVARKKLVLKKSENFFSAALLFIFLAGALYEIYYFGLK